MKKNSKLVSSILDLLQVVRELHRVRGDSKKRAKVLGAMMLLDNGLAELESRDSHIVKSVMRDYWHGYFTPREDLEHERYYLNEDYKPLPGINL